MTSTQIDQNINSTIDEKNKTLTVRQAEYTLQKGSYLDGYHTIIYATKVTIKDNFKNPGCDVKIFAAEIFIDEKGGLIDVNGANGQTFKAGDRKDGTGTKSGTYNGADGSDGKNGGKGQNAGTVTLNAGKISGGKLTILGNGGNGGRAQDGGKGANGVTPPDMGKPARPKQIVTGTRLVYLDHGVTKTEKIYAWDKDVKQLASNDFGARLYVAHLAKVGNKGGHGGNGGIPGIAGNGGNGSKIFIRSLDKSDLILNKHYEKGKQATIAKLGVPGIYAKGGKGGKYLYKGTVGFIDIDWSTRDGDSKWKKHWSNGKHLKNLGVSNTFLETVGGIKILKLRNKAGPRGENGGFGINGVKDKPTITKAVDGKDGSVNTVVFTDPVVFSNIPQAYYLQLQRSATIAKTNGNTEQTIAILQWLIFLTSRFRTLNEKPSAQALEGQQIHHESESTLFTLLRHDNKNLAKRFIYKDIERYADFVESSLTHVQFQSQNFKDFKKSLADKAKQKTALNSAIKETQQHIQQLTGNSLKSGSIEYFKETEKQLKLGLSDLDLQLLNYKTQLEQMPTDLQNELDEEYYKKTQISFWDVLQYVSMAAGVVMNFASAASSIKSMVTQVKDFYKEAMELSSWADILKDGIWNREFSDLKGDLSQLIETSEFKKMSKDGKAFITSVTDFQGKILAYDELVNDKTTIDIDMDLMDIQASVLVFDMAKLKLKKQRTELESNLRNLIDDSKAAQKWEHLFTDYFDSSITRFDMLAHLADLQASRSQLEFQSAQLQRNVEKQKSTLNQLNLNTTNTNFITTTETLEANLYIALQQSLERIRDEYQAFNIWTLQSIPFPQITGDLSLEDLKIQFHKPIWNLIKDKLSSSSPPASRDFSDTPILRRFEIPADRLKNVYFNKGKNRWRFLINFPLNTDSNIYFQRIIDAQVFLKGITVAEGSAIHCILRHRGISRYLNKDRQQVRADQNKRSVEFSYIIEDGKPNYHYPGAITNPFDDKNDWLSRIRYSPYTTWEIEIIPNYKQNATSRTYNQDIDFSNLEAIEFRYEAFFESFAVRKVKAS